MFDCACATLSQCLLVARSGIDASMAAFSSSIICDFYAMRVWMAPPSVYPFQFINYTVAMPFLAILQAFRVSVGRLGVITSLKFRIVREQPAMRTVTAIAPSHFIEMLRSAQDMFNEEGILPEWMNETTIFWFVQEQVVSWSI